MRGVLFATLILLLSSTKLYAQSWLKVDWGSSREDVHYSEVGQLFQWELATTYYKDEVDGQAYARRYRFIGDSLVAATKYPDIDMNNLLNERLFDLVDQVVELKADGVQSMGEPDFIDEHNELSVRHLAWNLGPVFAIAQVSKDNDSGEIWYSPGELDGNKRRKRYQNKRGALRELYRELAGEDEFLLGARPDLPPGLEDNPSLSIEDKLASRYDEMLDRRIYSDPSIGNNRADNEIALYLIEQEGILQLILNKTYSASDWLFINSMIVLADGERFTIDDIYDHVSRSTTFSGIKEDLQIVVDEELENIVLAMANAREVRIRLNGTDSYRDIVISEREKRALRNVLALFDKRSKQ